jgi:crotonobetainyl-CoA:carnitine CoA-transferase CaiB-like acyl-CoA transferase
MKPLEGIRVLDLTRLLPGAVATQQLVDWGAEVIKIEAPVTGDYARSMNPPLFARTNSGKKSVVLDLKTAAGSGALRTLARTADILVEGNRPGVMERLGLGYEALANENQRLIFVSLTGYGQTGPYAALAGHDINYIALGGLLGLNLPVIPGVQIADLVGGSMQAVTGILLALQERARTGRGKFVDVSMLAGVLSLLWIPLAEYNSTGLDQMRGSRRLNGALACYQIYTAADGRSLAVGALEPKFWQELCRRLGCEELIPLQFDSNQTAIKERVADIFKTKTAAQWFDALRDSDCCVTPVRTIAEIAAELPPFSGPPAPALGEHNEEILGQV